MSNAERPKKPEIPTRDIGAEVGRCLTVLNANLYTAPEVNDHVETTCPVDSPEVLDALRHLLLQGLRNTPLEFCNAEVGEGDVCVFCVAVLPRHREILRTELLRLRVGLLSRRFDDPVLQSAESRLRDSGCDPFVILLDTIESLAIVSQSSLRMATERQVYMPMPPIKFLVPEADALRRDLDTLGQRVSEVERRLRNL